MAVSRVSGAAAAAVAIATATTMAIFVVAAEPNPMHQTRTPLLGAASALPSCRPFSCFFSYCSTSSSSSSSSLGEWSSLLTAAAEAPAFAMRVRPRRLVRRCAVGGGERGRDGILGSAASLRLAATAANTRSSSSSSSSSLSMALDEKDEKDVSGGGGKYFRQGEEVRAKKRDPPYPKVGDVVRFTELDGGAADGQVLVGKIALIQPILSSSSSYPSASVTDKEGHDDDGANRWLAEIQELEDVGDGYYADYPSRKRRSKRALRKLEEVAPLSASYVRSEDAYRVPRDSDGRPISTHGRYNLVGYAGPTPTNVNVDVVRTDGERYAELKAGLIKNAALAGVFGTLVVQLTKGTEDALIYLAGAAAGVGYLFLLSVKTDTVGSPGAKLGNSVSNVRFVLPVLVLIAVAIRNVMGSADGGALGATAAAGGGGMQIFSTVTPEQFASAMLGFLTYRIPLFASQLSPVVADSLGDMLPGSAGVALRMAKDAKAEMEDGGGAAAAGGGIGQDLIPVLLVCGPPGTGKTSLVDGLMKDGGGRFVEPIWIDRVADGAKFERYERRDELLAVDATGRYGLTVEGVLNAAAASAEKEKEAVVVVDADVELAKKLTKVSKARLVGVWVGLDSMDKFEKRLRSQIASGTVLISENEDEASVVQGKMKEIVRDIEYGLVSGIFEFTILNDDYDASLKQLKNAAEYCFK